MPSPWGVRDYPQVFAFGWLIACPLCFGGVDLWARAILWLVIGVSLVLMAWLDPDWFRTFRGTGWITGLLLLWVLFATVPLPAGWVESIVPARIAGQSHTVLAGKPTATLAYMPGKTAEAFLTLFSQLAAVALFAHWARHHDGRRRLIWVMLLSAAGVMIVAWMNQFTPGHIYTRKIPTPGFMGPFTGRNIFADYLVLSSLVGIGFLFQRWWPLRGTPSKSKLTLISLAIVCCAVGWIMASASRGACLSWVTGLLLFGLFIWRVDVGGKRSIGIFITLFLVAALTVIYAQTLVKRIDTTLVQAKFGRVEAWRQSVKMGMDHGWTGVGLGNFQWVFPRYQPAHHADIYTHPENEYLEWWNETGWIGSFLILLLIFRVGRKLAVAHKWKDTEWQVGGLAALGALLVHSSVDFPLHIPANAFLAASIMGLVWGNLMRHPDESPRDGRGFFTRLAMIVAGGVLVCLAVFALRAEWLSGKGDDAAASRFWPIEPRYRYPLIEKQLGGMNYLDAHRLAIDVEAINPIDWKLYYLDGWALAPLARKTSDAQAAFDKAIYWTPAKSEVARKAGFFFWPRRPDVAVDLWKRSLENETDFGRAYYIFLQRTSGIPGQAEFARVLAGNRIDDLMVLSDWMAESGPRDMLAEIVQTILLKPPQDLESRENLMRLLLKMGKLKEAEGLSDQTPHKSVRLRFYQAEVYRQQGRWNEALDLYHALTAALPEGGKVPKMTQLGLETLQRKSEAEPDSLEIQSAYAWKLMKSGRWADADRLWARVIQKWPDYRDGPRFRAYCLEEEKQLEAATEAWKAYFLLVIPKA